MKKEKLQLIDTTKIKCVRSKNYNYNFNKETGYFERWGTNLEDDPIMAPFPEILDWEISTRCKNNCTFCIPSGYSVLTNIGYKEISTIKRGDIVISSHNNKQVSNQVIETYERDYTGNIIVIQLENNSIVKLTPEHPILTNRGWIEAKNINQTDNIVHIHDLEM